MFKEWWERQDYHRLEEYHTAAEWREIAEAAFKAGHTQRESEARAAAELPRPKIVSKGVYHCPTCGAIERVEH